MMHDLPSDILNSIADISCEHAALCATCKEWYVSIVPPSVFSVSRRKLEHSTAHYGGGLHNVLHLGRLRRSQTACLVHGCDQPRTHFRLEAGMPYTLCPYCVSHTDAFIMMPHSTWYNLDRTVSGPMCTFM